MQKNRILFIDLARGLAILFMVMVHVLEEISLENVQDSLFGEILEFLGGPPAAPVFMFLMGTSFVFSARSDLKQGVIRGVKLLALAYLMNFLRGTLPAWITLWLNIWSPQDLAPYTPLNLFTLVDILQFSGLALIILPFVRRYIKKPIYWLLLAFAVAVFSPHLWGRMSGIVPLDWLLTLLWGTGDMVAFPVFPWLVYPLCGMAFGVWLLSAENRQHYLRLSALAGLGCLLIGTIITATDYEFHVGDYWRSGSGVLIWIIGFTLVELFGCSLLVNKWPTNAAFRVLYFWSSRVTAFYFIHWIIIGWLSFFMTYWIDIDSIASSLLVMCLVAVCTHFCFYWWSNRKKDPKPTSGSSQIVTS